MKKAALLGRRAADKRGSGVGAGEMGLAGGWGRPNRGRARPSLERLRKPPSDRAGGTTRRNDSAYGPEKTAARRGKRAISPASFRRPEDAFS